MSKLLINEHPLQVLPALAKAIGLNEAIVTQQVHYWIANKKNAGIDHEGHKWVHNTYQQWMEDNFPFWSIPTIQRTFASCEALKVLISSQPFKKNRNMTKAYRVHYDMLENINLICSQGIKLTPSSISNWNHVKGTETTTEITTDMINSELLEKLLQSLELSSVPYFSRKDFELWVQNADIQGGIIFITTHKAGKGNEYTFANIDDSAGYLESKFGATLRHNLNFLEAKEVQFVNGE